MSGYVKEKEEIQEERIDLIRIIEAMWRGVRKYWYVLLAVIVICAGAMYIRAVRSYTPRYSSSATFTVSSANQSLYGTSNYYNNVTATQMAKTFPYILTSGLLNKTVAEDLGVETIPGTITAQSVAGTNLFTIEVTAGNPQTAYEILTSVIENYPSVAEYVIGKTSMELLDITGVATEPSNAPAFRNSAVKGAILGIFMDLVLVFGYAATRRTIHSGEDFKKLLNVECICAVPQITFKKRGKEFYRDVTIRNKKIAQPFVEAVRILRVRVEKEAQRERRKRKTILVTSAIPGEGKSTIAANVALSLAMNGMKVALVDCDLRGPSVQNTLNLQGEWKGLSDFLTGKCTLPEVLHYEEAYNLYVIPGGQSCQECPDAIDSPLMSSMTKQLRQVVDYIILDTAPVGMFADTASLAQYADMALFVVRQDYAKKDDILEGIDQLAESGIYLAGCVLNGAQGGIGGYGYRNYGYYSRYGYSRYSGAKEEKK